MEQFPQKYSEAPLIPDFPKAPSRNFWREIFKPEFCWTKGGKNPGFSSHKGMIQLLRCWAKAQKQEQKSVC